MNLRPYRQEDRAACLSLIDGNTPTYFAPHERAEYDVFLDDPGDWYWVAEEDGEILGVCLAIPEWSDWRNGAVLWIHSLYVVPEARERGIFKKLYENLKKQVEQSEGLMGLRVYVDKKNRRAQQVYEKLGMSKDHYDLYEWLK